jgi:hypothetical protein
MSTAVLLETSVAATAPVDELLRQLRAMNVRLPHLAEVRNYLLRYPDVISSIRNASQMAAKEFTNEAVLSLELYVDPEIDDRYLTLYLRQAESAPNFYERVRYVGDNYLCEFDGTGGWFLVTTDFQPPQ